MGNPDTSKTGCRPGRKRASREVADTYRGRIYQLAFHYLRNKEDAEEVTQDVLLKVYRKVDSFRGDSALSSWIYRITFNAAMSRLRTRGASPSRRPSTVSHGGGLRRPTVRLPTGPIWGTSRCFAASWASGVQRDSGVPRDLSRPVVCRDIQGTSTEEASAVLHVKDQTLKSRLHRGRLILRRSLPTSREGCRCTRRLD